MPLTARLTLLLGGCQRQVNGDVRYWQPIADMSPDDPWRSLTFPETGHYPCNPGCLKTGGADICLSSLHWEVRRSVSLKGVDRSQIRLYTERHFRWFSALCSDTATSKITPSPAVGACSGITNLVPEGSTSYSKAAQELLRAASFWELVRRKSMPR